MQVTYIANEGFLVRIGSKKILIDALFGKWESDWCDVPTGDVIAWMEKAGEPFDRIDLILVSHAHIDHFNPQIVASHMENNPAGILACPRAAVEELEKSVNAAKFSSRVKEVTPEVGTSVKIEANGVRVTVWRLPHGAYLVKEEDSGEMYNKHEHVQHLGFTVEAGEERFFHGGDWAGPVSGKDPDPLSTGDGVNVAFLAPEAVISYYGAITRTGREYPKPGNIVLMHLLPGGEVGDASEEEKNALSDLMIFKSPMESRWI